jgi:SNF2 family DNA or RNA helicase
MKLIPDQETGVQTILKAFTKHKGFLLADRPGLGKTAQAIAVMKEALKTGRPVLVIVPAYLVSNWLDEFTLWGVDNEVCVIDSGKQELYTADIYIGSYSLTTSDNVFKQLLKFEYSLLLLDESHYLKAWNSKRSRRILGTYQNKVKHFRNRSKRVLGLTGTPVLNRVEELYNVLVRLAPEIFNGMSKEHFIIYFSAHVQHTPWGMKARGIKNEEELKKIIAPVFLSRSNIDGLPARQDKTITVDLKGKELKDFIKEENAFLHAHGVTENDITSIQKLTSTDMSAISEVRQKAALYKIPLACTVLSDLLEKEERPLLYCFHRSVQAAAVEDIKKKFPDLRIGVVNGSVNKEKRVEIVKHFQDGEIDLIVATIGALREGVNITKGSAIVFLELDWTPANIEQAVARLHRKGQKNIVKVFFIVFKTGIDKYILNMVKDKTTVIHKIMK